MPSLSCGNTSFSFFEEKKKKEEEEKEEEERWCYRGCVQLFLFLLWETKLRVSSIWKLFDLKIGRKGWAKKEIAPFQFVNEK